VVLIHRSLTTAVDEPGLKLGVEDALILGLQTGAARRRRSAERIPTHSSRLEGCEVRVTSAISPASVA
jgi:hypothetical protein